MAKRVKAAQPANSGPESILPLTDFRGDPWGTGNENAVAFRAGILSSPVPSEFAQRMRDEGKAAEKSRVNPAEPVELAADTATDQPEG